MFKQSKIEFVEESKAKISIKYTDVFRFKESEQVIVMDKRDAVVIAKNILKLLDGEV